MGFTEYLGERATLTGDFDCHVCLFVCLLS